MSNVYILEPPTSAKVLLKTTVGDIDIELWAKETPKTCRNFIQLCLEGYYDGTVFHRIVKGFIAQGGDPNGDGSGGESIYGEPFKDEFHQRLKFVRRGLLAMANSEKDDNASQFFFTLGATPELQNKHTIFGKVTGETLFNMLKLEEGLIEGETPVYPHKIIKTEVLNNYFSDIVPRVKESKHSNKKKKDRTPGVKNFKLLSFGAEAEEDEEETKIETQKFSGKSKSTHDVLNDPLLSAAVEVAPEPEETETNPEDQLENIRKKLKTSHNKPEKKKSQANVPAEDSDQSDSDDDKLKKIQTSYLYEERDKERQKKREEIQKEIESVKREYQKNKLQKELESKEEKDEESQKSETIQEYHKDQEKYKEINKSFPRKGKSREDFTLQLLAKFKQKLSAVKEKEQEEIEKKKAEEEETAKEKDESWLSHELHFKDDDPILAKDANTKGDDWFEIYDPRNPLNKRRRGENTQTNTRK